MTKEHVRYQRLKKKLKGRYKTLSAAAARFGCHPNSFREVCRGECPNIRERLIADEMLPGSKPTEIAA